MDFIINLLAMFAIVYVSAKIIFDGKSKYEAKCELRKEYMETIRECEESLLIHQRDYPEDSRGIQQRIDYINHLKKEMDSI